LNPAGRFASGSGEGDDLSGMKRTPKNLKKTLKGSK
jgi:hypothetical protein